MSLLDDKDRLNLAVRLLRERARISIAHQETGLSRNRLRALYRELHGHSAPSGQLPAIGCATIQTRRQQVHASLLARLYERLGGDAVCQHLDIHALLAAQDLYRQLVGEAPEIDFNGAWIIARDLRAGASALKFCDCCRVRYLVSENSRPPPNCPICALYARRDVRGSVPAAGPGPRQASQGAPPEPHRVGSIASDGSEIPSRVLHPAPATAALDSRTPAVAAGTAARPSRTHGRGLDAEVILETYEDRQRCKRRRLRRGGEGR